jgi:molybdopterin molybdotransferase
VIGIQDAFDRLQEATEPVPAEEVALADAPGRIAAGDLAAGTPVPDFRRAMMDGYAVRVEDVADAAPDDAVTLRVTGEVTAGRTADGGPGPGEAWEISTGTPLPGPADGVVPYEWTRRAEAGDGEPGTRIEVRRSLGPGAKGTNVAPPGEDVEAGAVLLEGGRVADARHVAALAAAGEERVRVRRRPRVAVISTGDEIVPVGEPRAPGQIHDSNSVSLAAAVRAAGARTVHVGSAPDREDAIAAELEEALAASPDVVLTTGGVSVGPRDLVPDVWRKLGAEELFDGVAIKPGKPVFAADLAGEGPEGRDVRVVGLSGTPPANAVAYVSLVRPMLLRLAGRRAVMPRRVRVRVEDGYPKEADMTRLLWCAVSDGDEPLAGSLAPVREHSKLVGICRANALVVMPAGTGPWPAGEEVAGFRLDRPATQPGFRYR